MLMAYSLVQSSKTLPPPAFSMSFTFLILHIVHKLEARLHYELPTFQFPNISPGRLCDGLRSPHPLSI